MVSSVPVDACANARRRRRAGWVLTALAGAAVGCFQPDYLVYAACGASETCHEAGLRACVLLPSLPGQPGYCAGGCAADSDCPAGQTGDAAPRCVAVAEVSVCGLDCGEERTCPEGYVCLEVADAAMTARSLCFPAEDPG